MAVDEIKRLLKEKSEDEVFAYYTEFVSDLGTATDIFLTYGEEFFEAIKPIDLFTTTYYSHSYIDLRDKYIYIDSCDHLVTTNDLWEFIEEQYDEDGFYEWCERKGYVSLLDEENL